MSLEPMPLFWLVLTLVAYLGSRWLYRRSGRYVLSPLILVPALLLAVAVPLHTAYAEYARDTHWLMGVLGPVTVAFAVPIWQQRMMLARHWPALLVGMLAGSMADRQLTGPGAPAGTRQCGEPVVVAALDHHALCHALGPRPGRRAGADGGVRHVHRRTWRHVRGVLLRVLPLRTPLARGALFGVGAHGAGVSRAQEVGREEGSVAGLVMVLTGLLNLFAGPCWQDCCDRSCP